MQTWKKETGCITTCISLHTGYRFQANAKDISGTTYNTFLAMTIPRPRPGIMVMLTGIIQMPHMMVTFIQSSINQP